MSLRRLLDTYIPSKVALDRRLMPLDIRVHLLVYDRSPWTVLALAEALEMSRESIRQSVVRLAQAGWVFTYLQPGRRRGYLVYSCLPPNVEQLVASMLTQRRTTVTYFSEWLMRCLLDFLVADRVHLDNAHPDWLITPEGSRLQLDRWYFNADVAFEFQGPQHFQKGDLFVRTDRELSRRLQYDGEKIRLCSLQGIELVEVQGLDLEFEAFEELLRGKLPLIPVRRTGPLFRQLLGMSRQYVNYLRKQ